MTSANLFEDVQMANSTVHDAESAGDNLQQQPCRSDEVASSPGVGKKFYHLVRRFASVSDVLRILGALAVASGMGFFLLDGVQVGNDLQRFYTSLGFAALLTTAGLVMSMLLREQRGSRVFIALALLSVPVNFTVFGALIYSVAPLDSLLNNYPQFAFWHAPSAASLVFAAGAGLAVLVPVVWFGLSVLARPARRWLSLALVLSSAVLLVPLREEMWAAALAFSAVVIVWFSYRRNGRDELALKTLEGRFSLALLFAAPVIVIARSMFLYQVSGFLVLTMCTGLYLCTRQLMTSRRAGSVSAMLLTVGTAAGIALVTLSSFDLLINFIPEYWVAIVCGVGALVLTADLVQTGTSRLTACRVAALLVTLVSLALVANAIMALSGVIAIASVLILLVTITYGYYNKLTAICWIALAAIVAILTINAEALWNNVAATGWWGIAVGGCVAILAGSILDRAGTVVQVESSHAG
ncbi:hypothetical protein AB833_29290 [Chromatiales bacterium (ex Bugula neritina AB1)]|nr:hypothetical protein AB833_29290 [Chromatiales bacterium (ex Bugula neritina AB1)]